MLPGGTLRVQVPSSHILEGKRCETDGQTDRQTDKGLGFRVLGGRERYGRETG